MEAVRPASPQTEENTNLNPSEPPIPLLNRNFPSGFVKLPLFFTSGRIRRHLKAITSSSLNEEDINASLMKAVDLMRQHNLGNIVNENISNTFTYSGYRAVHYAAISGNASAIEILSQVPEFDPNIKNTGGYPAIHSAIARLYHENAANPQKIAKVVCALLNAGADANLTSNNGYFPLQYAISYLGIQGAPTYSALIYGVGRNKANLGAIDGSGKNAFEYADYYKFNLNEIPLSINGEECGTLEENLNFNREVIHPFRRMHHLEGESLLQAREKFCRCSIEANAPLLGSVFRSCYLEEPLTIDQLSLLAEAAIQDEQLDQNYAILACLAIDKYTQASTQEERDRSMDEFWLYFSGLAPIEADQPMRSNNPPPEINFTCEAIKMVVFKVVLPTAAMLSPIGQMAAGAIVATNYCCNNWKQISEILKCFF